MKDCNSKKTNFRLFLTRNIPLTKELNKPKEEPIKKEDQQQFLYVKQSLIVSV